MTWQSKVPGCFGSVDTKFGAHPSDEIFAKTVIREAKTAGASFQDFEKEIVWHCYKNVIADNFLEKHIQEQVKRAKTLW